MFIMSLGADIRIGDVFIVDFVGDGSVQSGRRPAVVFQNNKGNAHSPNVVVFPMTSKIKKRSLPTHVFVGASESGLSRNSVVLCENPVCIPKSMLGRYVTTLPESALSRLAAANLLASGAVAFLRQEDLHILRDRAAVLNGVA